MEFEKAIQILCDAGVEFVVIGGLSAALHGSAQVTCDLDVRYSQSSANLRRLTGVLAPFHPRPRGFRANLPFVWHEVTLRNKIDLLSEVAGIGAFEAVKAQSIIVDALDRRIATLESLLESEDE